MEVGEAQWALGSSGKPRFQGKISGKTTTGGRAETIVRLPMGSGDEEARGASCIVI